MLDESSLPPSYLYNGQKLYLFVFDNGSVHLRASMGAPIILPDHVLQAAKLYANSPHYAGMTFAEFMEKMCGQDIYK